MCSGTILLFGIPRVVIGENQTFVGSEKLLIDEGVDLEVVNNVEIETIMQTFVENNPTLWNEDIGELED